jgi:hypothetical protein
MNIARTIGDLSYTLLGYALQLVGENFVKTLRVAILVPFLLVALLVVEPHVVHAAATGSWTTLSFPGASATVCGSMTVNGGSITSTAPAAFTFTAIDGNGVVVRSRSGNGGIGTFTSYGTEPFTTQPTKNPIRVIIIVDGTTVFDKMADNPCRPGSAGGSAVKFFDPGDDRLNRDPGQPAALYCRNQGVHIYAVNVDNSEGKLALIVTKAEIDAVINRNPSANTLIKQSSDGKFKLYYLPATKELSFITAEVRSGKSYSFVWKGLCR